MMIDTCIIHLPKLTQYRSPNRSHRLGRMICQCMISSYHNYVSVGDVDNRRGWEYVQQNGYGKTREISIVCSPVLLRTNYSKKERSNNTKNPGNWSNTDIELAIIILKNN